MSEDSAPVVTDTNPSVRTTMEITIFRRFRVLPRSTRKKLDWFLLQQGLQLSTVLEYRPAIDKSKSKYIKVRRHFISKQTIEQIFTNVVTTKIQDGDLPRQKVGYYSLADLKYDLKSGYVLPVISNFNISS